MLNYNKAVRACRRSLLAMALSAAICQPSPAPAQQVQDPCTQGWDGQQLRIELIKTGLYLVCGGGGNSVVRLSASGMIVVDGKRPEAYETFRAQLERISEQPVRVLINTSARADRTGTNPKFIEGGTRLLLNAGAVKNLPDYASKLPVSPVITYDRQYSVKLGGVEAQLWHFGRAHTDSDTVVYFPNLKVVALGDLIAANPDPDFSAGGSLLGWGPVLDQVLQLDFDVAVPGTGPMWSKADLEKFKTKMDSLTSRAATLVRQGVRRDALRVRLTTDDLGWHFNPEQLDGLYTELSVREHAVSRRDPR